MDLDIVRITYGNIVVTPLFSKLQKNERKHSFEDSSKRAIDGFTCTCTLVQYALRCKYDFMLTINFF